MKSLRDYITTLRLIIVTLLYYEILSSWKSKNISSKPPFHQELPCILCLLSSYSNLIWYRWKQVKMPTLFEIHLFSIILFEPILPSFSSKVTFRIILSFYSYLNSYSIWMEASSTNTHRSWDSFFYSFPSYASPPHSKYHRNSSRAVKIHILPPSPSSPFRL